MNDLTRSDDAEWGIRGKTGAWPPIGNQATGVSPGIESVAVVVLAGLVDGFVYLELASVELLSVEGGDRGASLVLGSHFNETESLGPAGIAVGDDLY